MGLKTMWRRLETLWPRREYAWLRDKYGRVEKVRMRRFTGGQIILENPFYSHWVRVNPDGTGLGDPNSQQGGSTGDGLVQDWWPAAGEMDMKRWLREQRQESGADDGRLTMRELGAAQFAGEV